MPTYQSQAEATYLKHLPALQSWVGWFALIRADRLAGIFPTYSAAATAWMAMYGPVPALIRRIEAVATAVVDPPAAPAVLEWRPSADRPTAGPQMAVACNWAMPFGRREPRTEYAA